MEIKGLEKRGDIPQDSKLSGKYDQLNALLQELRNREIPAEVVAAINQDIEKLNASANSHKELNKQLIKTQYRIIQLLEKELKLVPINHYRNMWLSLGMACFGIPIGVVFGLSIGNMAFLGIGLPIGMTLGMAVGSAMDKKARENGQQLALEISY